jgi:hypothetical protein
VRRDDELVALLVVRRPAQRADARRPEHAQPLELGVDEGQGPAAQLIHEISVKDPTRRSMNMDIEHEPQVGRGAAPLYFDGGKGDRRPFWSVAGRGG